MNENLTSGGIQLEVLINRQLPVNLRSILKWSWWSTISWTFEIQVNIFPGSEKYLNRLCLLSLRIIPTAYKVMPLFIEKHSPKFRGSNGWLKVIYLLKIFPLRSLMLIFLLLPFISCSSLPGVSTRAISPVQGMKPRIVFLMMRMIRDSLSGSNSVELVKKTILDGSLKKQKNSEVHFGEYLSIEVLEEGTPPHTFSIDHPLVKHVEYEQNKELVAKEIRLNKSEFFVRLQVHKAAATVNIYENTGNSARKKLLSIPL